MSSLYKLFGALSCAALIASCGQQSRSAPVYPPQTSVCEYFDKSQDVLEFWLGIPPAKKTPDVKLQIPVEYLDRFNQAYAKTGVSEGTAYIRFRISDFAPYSQLQTKVGIKKDPTPYGRLYIGHVSDLTLHFGTIFRLSSKEVSQFLLSQPKPEAGNVYPKKRGTAGRDIYFDYKDNKITDLMFCTADRKFSSRSDKNSRPVNKQCEDFIASEIVGYKIYYDMDYLPIRAQIKKDAFEFLNCAILEQKQHVSK